MLTSYTYKPRIVIENKFHIVNGNKCIFFISDIWLKYSRNLNKQTIIVTFIYLLFKHSDIWYLKTEVKRLLYSILL